MPGRSVSGSVPVRFFWFSVFGFFGYKDIETIRLSMKFGSGPVRFFSVLVGSDNNYKNRLISDKFLVSIQLRFGSDFFFG